MLDNKINKAVSLVLTKWLKENNDKLLHNISMSIHQWLEDNKETIFDIIKEESNASKL